MSSQLGILHRHTVLSRDADAKYFPFGENITLFTVSV